MEKQDEYLKLKPFYSPKNPYGNLFLGGSIFILFSLFNSNDIFAIIPLIIGLFLIFGGFIVYKKTPHVIVISREKLILEKDSLNWNEIKQITFTFRGSRVRHVAEILTNTRKVVISLAKYHKRLPLRLSLEKVAKEACVKVVIEDRYQEDFWF